MGAMADAIARNIGGGLKPIRFELVDDSHKHAGHAGARPEGETHFRILVVSAAFEGKSRIARQQMVYGLLREEFARGLHALAMSTLTPAEDSGRSI